MLEYEGSIWRPPSEAQSLILQATVGCSHNACIYCVSYKGKRYRVRGAEGIKSDLTHLTAMQKRSVKRVFLADGNALSIETDEILAMLSVLREQMPNLERVGVYAYAKDVRCKPVDELKQLHSAGLGIAYFGLETGDDEILRSVQKGVSSAENVAACRKIREAGIPLSITIILGLGGNELSERHAVLTAHALNEIDPEYVGALTLMVPRGTPLFDMVQRGEFKPMDPFEVLRELRLLIDSLELSECLFRTNHASNYLPIGATLNRDKEEILSVITKVLASEDTAALRPGYLRGL